MKPLPPGRLSTTICHPSRSVILLVTMRVDVSTTPPGAYGTSTRIGLVGYSCAADTAHKSAPATVITIRVSISPALEKVIPLLASFFLQFLARLGDLRKIVEMVVRPARVDDRLGAVRRQIGRASCRERAQEALDTVSL